MSKVNKEEIEERKVRALEKIALSLDTLTLWFEEIDKEDWDNRLQFYLKFLIDRYTNQNIYLLR